MYSASHAVLRVKGDFQMIGNIIWRVKPREQNEHALRKVT